MSRVRHSIETVAYGISVLNTTNLRIYISLMCVVWTAANYMLRANWVPTDSWLMFLIALCAADVAQYTSKRMTTFKPENGASTTDVQEIQKG